MKMPVIKSYQLYDPDGEYVGEITNEDTLMYIKDKVCDEDRCGYHIKDGSRVIIVLDKNGSNHKQYADKIMKFIEEPVSLFAYESKKIKKRSNNRELQNYDFTLGYRYGTTYPPFVPLRMQTDETIEQRMWMDNYCRHTFTQHGIQ